MEKAYIECSGEHGNLLVSPTPKYPYLNGSTKMLGGRCNNYCKQLKRGHNYKDSGWCRTCQIFVFIKNCVESSIGVKLCPCCHANIGEEHCDMKT